MRCSASEKALFDALRLIFSREYKFCDISASRSFLPKRIHTMGTPNTYVFGKYSANPCLVLTPL